jgi:hypothetical protein
LCGLKRVKKATSIAWGLIGPNEWKLDTPLRLDHENANRSNGMCDMLGPNRCIEDIADFEGDRFLGTVYSVMHAHLPVEDNKN